MFMAGSRPPRDPLLQAGEGANTFSRLQEKAAGEAGQMRVFGSLLGRRKIGRHAVDAIAQPGGRRAVGKHVAEMRAASGAMHLGAGHAPAAVDRSLDRVLDRRIEARPAGAAVELGLALEQWLATAGAGEHARALLPIERATARAFGAMFAHDRVLLGGQQGAPLGFRAGDGEMALAHEVLLTILSQPPNMAAGRRSRADARTLRGSR